MNPSSNFSYFSSSTATVTYSFHNDHATLSRTTEIPHKPPLPKSTAQSSTATSAATRIQSCYRAHMIRTLYRKISAVITKHNPTAGNSGCNKKSEKEKLRMNEALMGLLLRLDSVPGVDPTVREARRKVSRRIVGLQEILDRYVKQNSELMGRTIVGGSGTLMVDGIRCWRRWRRRFVWREVAKKWRSFVLNTLG
uniref:BAG domain-containing protein n=1 Tax=Salix viminalis TaxID=40686 RepID=A0A6N2K188_SALVM